MKRLLIILALSVCAIAQTGKFPTLATDQDLVVAKTNASSTLTTTVNASTLTWVVADGSKFSAYEIIRSGDEYTQICSIAANTLTLCTGTRGLVGSAATHLAGATVQDVISEYHHNALRVEVKAIEGRILPARAGTSLPGDCTADKELYYKTDDRTLHGCNATGTGWEDLGGTGGTGDAATTPSVSFSATPTFTCNANTSTTFRITLTGNVTSSTLASCATGQLVTFRICQDGSGAHTFVFPTSVLNAGTIDATASACSVQTFVWDGTFAQALGTMLVTGPTGGQITLNNSSSGTTTVAAPATGTNALTLPSNNGVILSTLSLPGTSLAGPVKAKVCSGIGADYAVQNLNTDGSVDCVQMTGGGGGSSTAQGTAAAIPGTCTTGNLYFTTDSLYTLRCSATNAWSYFIDGQSVTPPTGSWAFDHATGLNGPTVTVDTTRKYHSILAPKDTHQSTDGTMYYTTAPAAPYTRTFVIRPNMPAAASGTQAWAVGFQEASTHKFVVFMAESPNGDGYRSRYGTYKGDSVTTWNSPGFDVSQQAPGGMSLFSGFVWVRLTDNNTNLIFEVSFDGQFFTTLQTVSRTAHMSGGPDRLVVGIKNAGSTVHDVHVNIVGIQ